eukprot:SAG22_NODE_1593_length_4040_cov_2.951028_4_plen_217_part_01
MGKASSRKHTRPAAAAAAAAVAAPSPNEGRASKRARAAAQADDDPAGNSSSSDSEEESLAYGPIESDWAVGDFLSPPFRGHQLERLQKAYNDNGRNYVFVKHPSRGAPRTHKYIHIKSRKPNAKVGHAADGSLLRKPPLRQWGPTGLALGRPGKKQTAKQAAASKRAEEKAATAAAAAASPRDGESGDAALVPSGKFELRCTSCHVVAATAPPGLGF